MPTTKKVSTSPVRKKAKPIAVKKPVSKTSLKTLVKKATKPAKPLTKKVNQIAVKKVIAKPGLKTSATKNAKPAKSKTKATDSSSLGISIPEILKQAEEMHLVPLQSIVHPQTIEEHKKFEPQNYERQAVTMHNENEKAMEAKANRKGTKRIYRMRKS